MNNKGDENESITYPLESELYSFEKSSMDIETKINNVLRKKTKINNVLQSKGLYILYLYDYYKDVY